MAQFQKSDIRILIVDDVESNRFLLKDIITEMGYQSLLAENGAQALKVVDRFYPQLIITDIAMPIMDGIEFCQRLKADPKTRDIPVIFLSAFSESSEIVKGFEAGGADYIAKPFMTEVVKARVSLQLRLYETQVELSESNRRMQSSLQEQLRQIEQEKKNVLYALVRVARENAAYDERHMERLCYNSKLLAEALQLTNEYSNAISDSFIDTLTLAAPLCDLGNVGIPTEVLQKREMLEETDRAVIRNHSDIGSRIIHDICKMESENEFLNMSYDIARFHHERYGGGGYPDGIKGDSIPLSAQIVSVAGAFCSLTEKRLYRNAYTPEEAVEMLKQMSGVKYNPAIVNVFAMIYRQMK